ncbi:MAG TPA: hypothetical protein VL356_04640, partial [Acidocella sp.]|nr:hypothetical protein [Acidocella sp.]
VIVVGGGSFGPIFAQHFMYRDATRARRILILEAGRLTLPEHVQNMPMVGLNVPGPTTVDPGAFRNEVWGLPWRSDVPQGFPGLAYAMGGRSLFFGGWSPRLLPTELPAAWPAAVVNDLNGPLADGRVGYFAGGEGAAAGCGASAPGRRVWFRARGGGARCRGCHGRRRRGRGGPARAPRSAGGRG